MCQLHGAGVYHGDIKAPNMGFHVSPGETIPVKSYSKLQFCIFDFGCSQYMEWDSGTRPYGGKAWFGMYPGRSGLSVVERCQATDYFQSLMTVAMLMVGKIPALDIGHTRKLGATWVDSFRAKVCSKFEGWIKWLLFHECNCDEVLKNNFCKPLSKYRSMYEQIEEYDNLFSSRFLNCVN